MQLLKAVAIAVLVQGLILLGQAASQQPEGNLINVLEEALKQLKEPQQQEDNDSQSEMAVLANNVTSVLKDLTEAIQNNTIEMMKRPGRGGYTAGHSGTVTCEPPFFSLRSECFYVNRYKRLSWSEARRFCKGLGGDLAEPMRVNSLQAMLLDQFPENEFQFFWVGAMETLSEGNWTWLSARRLESSDWAPGQPDGGNENCVVLSRDDFPPLHDSPCYTHTMFICERIVLSY